MARVLFVEPFYGGSHRAFADGLARHSSHEFTFLTLPGEEWRKRMRLGSQQLAGQARELGGEFDLIIATDMLDVPAFLALTRPRFERTPVLLYMHENQFTYPRIRGTKLNSWFGQINYLSALAVDRVAFNSEYHRSDFLDALRQLVAQPNNWLEAGAIDVIEAKSSVLPIGLELGWLDETRPPAPAANQVPLILWNHRWEFDKSPGMFVRALGLLADEGLDFRVAVAGEPGNNPHPELVELPDVLGERLVQHGHLANRGDYARLLWEADIVVSTARHEFFGVSTVEAMYCGCAPVLPNKLNYPNLVPENQHGACLYDTEEEFAEMLRLGIRGARPDTEALRDAASAYDWSRVGPEWDTGVADLLK
jgi:glycosyltransferase involved in cell wall biosynthesis